MQNDQGRQVRPHDHVSCNAHGRKQGWPARTVMQTFLAELGKLGEVLYIRCLCLSSIASALNRTHFPSLASHLSFTCWVF